MNHLPGSPPGALAPLYGREHDLRQLLKLLHGGVRLLTLRGPGGVGKTALALHLAHALRQQGEPQFDHVQFIDLSAVREPEGVLGLIAAALPDQSLRGTPERRIQTFAARQRTLLVLDNFEQLLVAAPGLGHLLAATTNLQLVVTSRAALRLHDETEYPVGPLALPHRVRDAAASAAVQLFVARVQTLIPSFTLDQHNAGQVMRLCEVLEGIPLALELAAMRTRTYALGDLLTRLEHPLEVLKSDFRDRPERLRSLRAAVQWSYDLLDEVDRAVFECCAVFNGPFTPQALTEVWGSPEVLERAEGLLEQSLLQRLDTAQTLWRMLQPLRDLAVEHLEDHPLTHTWRDRHAQHFLNMVEEQERGWLSETVDHREMYLPHSPNIRAGMVWAVEQQHSGLAYRYLGAVGNLWEALGLVVQEAPLTERVLALPPPEDRVALLRALKRGAFSLNWTGQFQACEARLREIVALCHELGDRESEAVASFTRAKVLCDIGHGERAWNISQQIIHEWREQVGDRPPTCKQWLIGAQVHMVACQGLMEMERDAEALKYAELAGQYALKAGDRGYRLFSKTVEGHLLMTLHRWPEARTLLSACWQEAVEGGLRGRIDFVLRWGLIFLAAERREWPTLVQFTAYLNDPVGEQAQSRPDRRQRQDLARARQALGETAYKRAWTTGLHLQVADVVDLAERLVQVPISAPRTPGLTPREREVLALVAQGHPDRRVAQLLGISPTTTSKHVANLLGKLGLRNRVELARWVMTQGLAEGSSPLAGGPN